MRSASARKSSPQTVTAVWRPKSAGTEGFCIDTSALKDLADAGQIRDYVCDGCEDEVTRSNWVFLFSFVFLRRDLRRPAGRLKRVEWTQGGLGTVRAVCEYCRRNLSRTPFFSCHSVIRQPAIYSLGGETLISAWLCLFCSGADTREPSAAVCMRIQPWSTSPLRCQTLQIFIPAGCIITSWNKSGCTWQYFGHANVCFFFFLFLIFFE